MSPTQADSKKLAGLGGAEVLDSYVTAKGKLQPNGAVKYHQQDEYPDKQAGATQKSYSTNFSSGGAKLSSNVFKDPNPHTEESTSVMNQAPSFSFKHDSESTDVVRATRGTSVHYSSSVVEGLPPHKRSGELPRGSSSSSGDSPMFEICRPARKSGEIQRVSISSGASFSGEIPRGSSSSGEIADGYRSQKKGGELPRGSNSSGSLNGESEGHRGGAANRKSGELYHGNSSGGSSSGGSPTPEVFNRGRKSVEGPHGGSNSSAGSSDGGSPTAESLWSGKGGGVLLSTGMVTGGSFSSFNAVASGANPDSICNRKASNDNLKSQNGGLHVESNGARLSTNTAPTSRFLVGETRSRSSILSGDANLLKRESQVMRTVAEHKGVHGESAEDLKVLGNAEYTKGNFAKALLFYDRAIVFSPNQAAYRCNRAAALAGLGRLGEAVAECETAIKLDSSFSRAYQRLVSYHIRLGQTEDARKHFSLAGQQRDAGDAHRTTMIEKRMSNCLEAKKTKDWSSVIRECDAAIVAGADFCLQIYALKAEALLKLQRLKEVDAVLLAAGRVEEGSTKAIKQAFGTNVLVLKVQADMAQGRFDEAVAVAERAVRQEPKNFEIINLLRKARTVAKARATGNNFFKAGKFFEACAAYTEGLEQDPTNAVLLCNRAGSRSKLGQWEKTLEDCNAALQIQPNYMKALLRRAQSYSKLERWEDAVRDYEAVRREHPGDVEVAQALFDVQVALKKSRGEEISRTRFGGGVEEIIRNDQFREAISCPGLSVVEFTTRWSDRCRQYSAFVEELCRRYPSVNFSKVDVDDSPYLAQLESISSVPTFKIFRNGVNVKELLGPSQQGLEQAVKQCGV